MMRETKLHFLTRAGVEIGVASTKAFSTQLTALFLLSLTLAKLRGRLSVEQEHDHMRRLRHLPRALGAALALEPQVIAWAERFAAKEHALFLGRGLHYPIALEGALKLKEISYIHAEAYPAGELKHGPLALVTSEMPVVTVAPNDALLEKLKSNMQKCARGRRAVRADRRRHAHRIRRRRERDPPARALRAAFADAARGAAAAACVPHRARARHRRRQAAQPREVGDVE
jgi:glucosamine--fructose-6-phosphate aminotransferase (isomerizing)